MTPPPSGYVSAINYGGGWNATDATNCLQTAINSGNNIWVPKEASDWLVTPIEIQSHTNQTIQFESGTNITAEPGAFTGTYDRLFRMDECTNVNLVGPGATFKMQKADYENASLYTQSQHRHAIAMFGDMSCTISGLTIKDTGGDGIYLDYGDLVGGPGYCNNVTIDNVHINNAYRNGISVCDANNLKVQNSVITSTVGNPGGPWAGIDFEPGSPITWLRTSPSATALSVAIPGRESTSS